METKTLEKSEVQFTAPDNTIVQQD